MLKEQRTVKTYFFLFLSILALCGPISPAYAAIKYESHILSNGMQIIAIPNHRAPVVTHMVWYKIGAASEPAGKSGIAHFFEHLMFQETPSIAAGTFSKTIKQHGGNDNAFTSQDYTAYYQNIAKEHLPMVMQMEADRMQNLIITDDVIKSERDVIIEERRQRIDNNAGARFHERMNQALFPTHPYGIPVIGWKEEMTALNREDALKFYRQYYAPNNAILIVAGDITLAQLKPMAETYYGVNRMSKIDKMPLPPAAQLKEAKRVDFKSPQAGTNTLHIAYRAPRGYDALEVVSDLLGGNSTDYLYQELVVKDKIATHISTSYFPVTMGPSSFNIYATPAPNVTLETLEQALHQKLTAIVANGFSQNQIDTAKKRLTYQQIYQADSLQGPAMRVGMALTAGFDLGYVENWQQRIEGLRQNDIQTAIQYVFTNASNKPVIGTMRISKAESKQNTNKATATAPVPPPVTQEFLSETPTKTADEIAAATEQHEIEDAAVVIATTIAIAEEMEREAIIAPEAEATTTTETPATPDLPDDQAKDE